MPHDEVDGLITRYFPYLAFELRAAGLQGEAEAIMSSARREDLHASPGLSDILAAGVRTGVSMAFTVELRRRVLTLLLGDKSLTAHRGLRSELEELGDLFLAMNRYETGDDEELIDDGRERFDELFPRIERATGASTLLELLRFPSADGGPLTSPIALAALLAFVAEREWDQFHTPENLAKSISIEAAELLELYQWGGTPDQERVEEELADVLTYCTSTTPA